MRIVRRPRVIRRRRIVRRHTSRVALWLAVIYGVMIVGALSAAAGH